MKQRTDKRPPIGAKADGSGPGNWPSRAGSRRILLGRLVLPKAPSVNGSRVRVPGCVGCGLGGRGVAHARRRSVREAWLDQVLMVHAWQRQRVLPADPSPSILPGRVPPECRASATRSRPGIRAVMRTVPCAVELCSAASCMTSIVRPRSTVCCHVDGVSAHVRLTIILPIRTHHNRFPDVE
jgi:hypothetical protein